MEKLCEVDISLKIKLSRKKAKFNLDQHNIRHLCQGHRILFIIFVASKNGTINYAWLMVGNTKKRCQAYKRDCYFCLASASPCEGKNSAE